MNPPDGTVIYEIPPQRLEKMRRGLKILLLVVGVLQAAALVIIINVMLRGYLTGGLMSLGIMAGIIFMVVLVSGPLTMHNRLQIRRDRLVPLRRPFLSPKDTFLALSKIGSIRVNSLPGAERAFFHYEFRASSGRKYAVNSLVVARYDKSRGALEDVYTALEALRSEWEAATGRHAAGVASDSAR